ncbi:zinc finger protein 239-like [Vanessa atalanta]|uniref:zinc finger protein 239-like n=1 Tax=Vanessa atalanta TaxID=42275 RepID=UPI001FCCE458|nr:zinc finger protein 239-like [Vanessa atalanta]
MTEVCSMNSNRDENKSLPKDNGVLGVKEEQEITVKQELVDCLVCLNRTPENCDLSTTNTAAGTTLYDYLCKFTLNDIGKSTNGSKFICKTCLNLVNILERAEIEYLKLKEEFQSILSKNPLFVTQNIQVSVSLDPVKNESLDIDKNFDDDSEDEPLSLTKKKRHRKLDKRKKKTITDSKRKVRSKLCDDSWQCTECEVSGEAGGPEALATHMLLLHTLPGSIHIEKVKKEESPDRSQSPTFNNFDEMFKVEAEGFDDDDESSNYVPDELSNGKHSKRSKLLGRGKRKNGSSSTVKKKKDPKIIHQCDQCNAKYTSLVRLEQHKLKHDDSKPPYICEVCGAHYKHKRACDIHVAMHKGISDWKCEECNKLFPSKGALQRHNNIHTGKLNYQCDLCGKSFIHTSSFKMHKLSHSGVKPHSCDVCGLALMTRSHLKRHKRVHSGEKRHECGVCGKRFSERYNLAAHARAHAGEGAALALQPRRRLFRCAFCPERFERRVQLERHAGAAHGRALERPPPTPRNTMSKLLKAQAQRREPDCKPERSPPAAPAAPAAPAGAGAASSWAGVYAVEFGLRADYSH